MAEYKGSVGVGGGLTQLGGGKFAIANAPDIQVDDNGKRLNEWISETTENLREKANSELVEEIKKNVEEKASKEEVEEIKNNLEEQIDEKAPKTAISSPYNFKGSCLFSELPTSGNEVNDTYYCTDVKTKYTWNGMGWYQSSLDESDYQDELSRVKTIAVSEEEPTNENVVAYINPKRGNPISVMEPKDLINKNNLLQNPLFDGKDGWISTGEIVEAGDFANGIELVNEGSGVSAIQRIEYSKVKGMLGDGETAKMYHISYKTNDASKPCKVYVQAVGSGTTKMLFPLTTVNFSTKFEIDFSAIESELPSVHTIIIGFSFGWIGYSVVISEPFFGVYDDEYNGFWNKIFGDKVARKDFDVIATNVNPLYGKKISVNGDSICYGKGYTGGYGKIIAEKNGMTLQNIGVSGATIAAERYFTGSDGNPDTTKPRHWICRTIENMDSDADYAIIEGGVNDASQSDSVLGNISSSYAEVFDDTTFCGAFENMLKQLIVRFAGKKYGYIAIHKMAPSYRSENDESMSYYWAAKKCCEKWGVPFLDLNISVPPFNYLKTVDESLAALAAAYTDSGDGWHPNEEGYKKYYVPKIEAWLKTL